MSKKVKALLILILATAIIAAIIILPSITAIH